MKAITYLSVAVVALGGSAIYLARASERSAGEAAPIYGFKIPPRYRDWELISVAHEEGNNNDQRAILGNDIAINA